MYWENVKSVLAMENHLESLAWFRGPDACDWRTYKTMRILGNEPR